WEINYDSVKEFFNLQMIFNEKTYIHEIFAIENATFNHFSYDKDISNKYWKFKHNDNKVFNENEFVKDLSYIIEKIINEKTSDHNSYGIYMSGGMDSRAIIAA